MDSSLSHFEMESTENGSGSEKSDNIEILNYDETNNKFDEDFDNNLPETVALLTYPENGVKLYLVGTAHFSRESQEDVIKVIRNTTPLIVVLELCHSRTDILALDEQTVLEEAKNIDSRKIIQTIRRNGVYNGLMYILMLSMSAHITKEIGMAPGGEFRAAYREVLKIPGCGIHLGDRPINITLQRALARLTWFQTFKLAWHLLTTKDPISIEEIEKCKNRDMLEQLLADLAGEYPAFREVFLDERDVFLTNSLQMAADKIGPRDAYPDGPMPNVVGIVGIGHVPGIVRLWNENQEKYVESILKVPPPSFTSKLLLFTCRASLLTLGGYLIYRYVPLPRVLRENVQSVGKGLASSLRFTSN